MEKLLYKEKHDEQLSSHDGIYYNGTMKLQTKNGQLSYINRSMETGVYKNN